MWGGQKSYYVPDHNADVVYVYLFCCFCDSDKKSFPNDFYVIGFIGGIYPIFVPAPHMDIKAADNSNHVQKKL